MIIKGGRVIDPSAGVDETLDILVERGKIKEVGKFGAGRAGRVIDATGMWVVPGLIDIHTHLRDPGYEYKETIYTGSQAAAKGGFTSIACMANTMPVNDTRSVTEYILKKAGEESVVNIYVIAAVTKGLNGKELTEMGDLKAAGIVAFSDDGRGVQSAGVMRRAMEYASMLDLPVISHCEDETLAGRGVMSEGHVSTELALEGIPAESEGVMASRDISIAGFTGARIHIAHVGSAGTVDIVREAKKRGLRVTCETAPHYFTLTDEAVRGYRTNAKMNPPLGNLDDRAAIIEGLRDGTIDIIATDHAPHNSSEKEVEFNAAPFGIVGLETALPLVMNLVRDGILSPSEAFGKLTSNPSSLLKLGKGTLGVGEDADITIIDPEAEWVVKTEEFRSLGKNSPFIGERMTGLARVTIVGGKVVYRYQES